MSYLKHKTSSIEEIVLNKQWYKEDLHKKCLRKN